MIETCFMSAQVLNRGANAMLPCALLSEFGLDYWLERNRFAAPVGDADWWLENCRFRDALTMRFPPDAVHLSDQVTAVRSFIVWALKEDLFSKVCHECLRILRNWHNDACLVLPSPFNQYPGTASLVLMTEAAFADQDFLYQILLSGHCDTRNLPVDFSRSGRRFTDLRNTLSWLKATECRCSTSKEYWATVYAGNEMSVVENLGGEELGRAEAVGADIVSVLRERYWVLDDEARCSVYIARALGAHRAIKVECSASACTKKFVDGVLLRVRAIDKRWTVRFSVFDRLTSDDCYLGGFLVLPNGLFLIEAGTSK